jgi:PKD domain
MRSKNLGVLPIALIALAVLATPAAAVVANTAGGRVSYLPLNEAATAHSASPVRSTVPTGEPPLEYHGGPVMHSQTAYAIFWAPSGYAFPSGYTSAIEEFFKNVAADSGKPSNVYSVSAQYTDKTGRATYNDSFGGSIEDTDAYPTSGTCPTYKGFGGESFTACISDAKLEAEVDSVVNAQGWPRGLGAEYYVVLPPQAGSCFDAAGKECFDKQFCAYHSFTESSPEAIYSNISYSPGDVIGCGVGEYPNGHANGNVDDTLSSLSHEANESITDPTLEAWFDEEGFENGDECRNTPFGEDFGAPLGGPAGALFNQSIAGAHYYLQQEWSNDTEDCAQRVDPATPQIADPGQLVPGQPASFSGSGSAPGSGGIASFSWDFGDGGTAGGPNPTHAFQAPGTFTVTLTLEDDGGFTFSTTRQVSVVAPSSPVFNVTPTQLTPTQPPVARKRLKCRKGFRRAKRHGRAVCVKVKKKHRKHHR